MSSCRISIILPNFSRVACGGFKIVYIYANHLAEKGAQVTICFDCQSTLKRYRMPEALRRIICKLCVWYYPRWYQLDASIKKKCLFGITDEGVPNGEHVVATSLGTAEPVSTLNKAKGKKHYFIQGYEVWNSTKEYVEETYRLGMSNVVVSGWLAEIVRSASGISPRLIRNPIDQSVFYPDGSKRNNSEIAVLYHPHPHKGFDDLYQALLQVKEQFPALVVNAFGAVERPGWLPDWFHYTQNATQDELRAIYSRSLIYASAAKNEGFGLTLAEAMFCGCALVSTSFPGVFEYADGDTALLSPPSCPELLASNLMKLLVNPRAAKNMAQAGRHYAMDRCGLSVALDQIDHEFSL